MATRLFGSQTSLREANRANLLASIHKFGAMTQVELAEVTGLSTATVSTLVHQLVDEDQLETKSTVRNGRRATLVTLARHQGLGVGLWIARRWTGILRHLGGQVHGRGERLEISLAEPEKR